MYRAMTICMFAATLVVSVGCSAQPPKVIAERLCHQLDQAWANHDLNEVLGFIDSTYVFTDAQHKRKSYAEWRRQLEHDFPRSRNANGSTTVVDVQLVAGRMVVYYNSEMHYEYRDQDWGWVPLINKGSGEETWERKGGQWKLIRETVDRADQQVDPEWLKFQRDEAGRIGDTGVCIAGGRNDMCPHR